MVRELVHDPILLARKSEPAGEGDLELERHLYLLKELSVF